MTRPVWERRASAVMRLAQLDRDHAVARAAVVQCIEACDVELEDEPTEPRMDLAQVLAEATAHQGEAAE